MKKLIFIVFLTINFGVFAQSDKGDSSKKEESKKPSWKFEKERLTYGGGIGGGIYNGVTNINFSPIIAYRFTDKFLAGPRLIYNYYSVRNFGSFSNFGYGVLGRYFVKPNMFAHLEFENMYYDRGYFSGGRVPALLVGAGYFDRPIAISAMFDLLWNNNRSPYGSPFRVNFGIMF